ncbi:16S rRNA (uracil(1498)-N(3))-methyltransferase [Actinospica sp. MGRD01-02]|uniref:Ribosomal RNA small subunit methyltransferase E n=1 Tax=Actinospica acidithermotolerans TaxID=2828514 RepID=A0A941EGN3_9ACTN|nr:16S rRNA (uracil(1498)-N(3))-methyltransferase [Actinospica acidithermotolerans]MBR7830058.1 16S rRNA (uracil(1498)-N(3))-methyltransferase [Actinospica acidithermotolerans]
MTAPVFHAPRELLAGAGTVRLDGPEGRHAAVVRRLQPGESVDLTDGQGLVAHCVVARTMGNALDLDVVQAVEEPAPNPRLTIVQALAKGDRGETAVETMTEIGVDVIVPWSASRSITQWKADRGAKSLEKWRSTAREAAKQSRRAWWPEVAEPATTAAVARLLSAAALAIVLHEEAESALADVALPRAGGTTDDGAAGAADGRVAGTPDASSAGAAGADIVLVVGPEGGISPEELARFAEAGAQPYRMGPTVLRTSTAGTAAAAVLLARSGRWS